MGWTIAPRHYSVVAWRGERPGRELRSRTAATLEAAREAADAQLRDGWDGAWIYPSET